MAKEIQKGHYIGSALKDELEAVIGQFYTSPLSIILKAGRAGKYKVIQNLSFPPKASERYPHKAINAFIKADNFPCTWRTFITVCQIISKLPPGLQTAVCDMAEAYKTIPLHYLQWPAAVVRTGDDKYCVDVALCFGASLSVREYG